MDSGTNALIDSAIGVSKVRSQKQKPSWYCICEDGFDLKSCTSLRVERTISSPLASQPNPRSPFDDLGSLRILALRRPRRLAHFLNPKSSLQTLYSNVLALGICSIAWCRRGGVRGGA